MKWLTQAQFRIALQALALAALLLFSLWLLAGCGSTDDRTSPARVQKLDELASIVMQFEASPQAPADVGAAITSMLAVAGLDTAELDAVTPSATGILLVHELIEQHPEFAPFEAQLVKLYSAVLYGVPES